jgi:hypothetical protein
LVRVRRRLDPAHRGGGHADQAPGQRLPMTLAVRAFLYYLRRYLEEFPPQRGKLIARMNKQNGNTNGLVTLWRHCKLRTEPPAAVFLLYLDFLHQARAIRPARRGEKGLFIYTRPEFLRGKK